MAFSGFLSVKLLHVSPGVASFDSLSVSAVNTFRHRSPQKQQEAKGTKEIVVLDHKRSNAINICMTKLPPPRTIKTAILKMDATIINKEGIEASELDGFFSTKNGSVCGFVDFNVLLVLCLFPALPAVIEVFS